MGNQSHVVATLLKKNSEKDYYACPLLLHDELLKNI